MSQICGAAASRFGSSCCRFLGAGHRDYHLHIAITILLWAFIYTAWSIMGRFGLVSLGHGAFLGIGAYATALLWNFYGLSRRGSASRSRWRSPALVSLVIGYPCFRLASSDITSRW